MIRIGCIVKVKEDKDDVILNHVVCDENGTGYESPEHHESEAMAIWYCDTRNIVLVNEFLFTQIAQVKITIGEDGKSCRIDPIRKNTKSMTENEVRRLLTDNNVQFNA